MTPPLKILIVDDEPLARLRLRGLIDAINDQHLDLRAEVVAEAPTGSAASAWLRAHGCDLILLDVQMPGPDGLQFAQSLRERPGAASPLIVFVTAHALHALDAFELAALDYLTKPVRRERLQAALERAAQRLAERQAASTALATPMATEPAQDFLTLSERGRLVRLPLAEVLYFKAELKYLTVRTGTEVHVMDGSLSELEQRFGARFLRIHRNALVARAAVRELQRHAASATGFGELDGDAAAEGQETWAVRVAVVDEWLAVSRRQAAAVREALTERGGD